MYCPQSMRNAVTRAAAPATVFAQFRFTNGARFAIPIIITIFRPCPGKITGRTAEVFEEILEGGALILTGSRLSCIDKQHTKGSGQQ